jgi:NTE family protein
MTTNKYDNINEFIDNKIKNLTKKTHENNDKTILVLSGGGVKGISHIGSLKALEENDLLKHIKIIAGTSVGGIIGTLYAAGYTVDELYEFINILDLSKISSYKFDGVFTNFGFDDGDKLLYIIKQMFKAKNISPDITFKEFYELTNIKLILVATCLNDKQGHYLSNTTYPNLSVILGVRMTSSFPIWFTPVCYNDKMFIDGGCVNNYPIDLFINQLENVIGIHLVDGSSFTKKISNIEEFFYNLIGCIQEGITHRLLKGVEKFTINVKINLPSVAENDLNIGPEIKKELFDHGYTAANIYIKNIKDT